MCDHRGQTGSPETPGRTVHDMYFQSKYDEFRPRTIYEAFVEGRLEAAKHLARTVHDLYFEPKYEEFRPRTIWSLSNAFTSAFKVLEPIPPVQGHCQAG